MIMEETSKMPDRDTARVRTSEPADDDKKIDDVLDAAAGEKMTAGPAPDALAPRSYRPPSVRYCEADEIQSRTFNAEKLQHIVDEIKIIEDGIKNIIAARTTKIIEEEVPVEKKRAVRTAGLEKLLVRLGLKKQEYEDYTDYEIVKKEIPRDPDDVLITEFRVMIENYLGSLQGLNEGLRDTVYEVDGIVKNLTEVSDAFTDQIHGDRRAYRSQVAHSRDLEAQLEEIVPLHESMSPLHDRYAEVEKQRDHLEMALRESQGMELKYKTNIDMGVKYQAALKSYRALINDFKERGDIHVNMVDKFAQGASHMKIAVDNVSQICSGVARVTQSMVMIVESIDDGNRVLGRYASLVGDQISASPQWEMEYNALKEAEEVYKKNDNLRLEQIQENRKEIEKLLKLTE